MATQTDDELRSRTRAPASRSGTDAAIAQPGWGDARYQAFALMRLAFTV